MNLGKTLKQCRKLRGYTQSELANQAGLSTSHLSLIEQNKREPSLTLIKSLSKNLDIPLSILIFLSTQEEEIPELNSNQIDRLRNDLLKLVKHVTD